MSENIVGIWDLSFNYSSANDVQVSIDLTESRNAFDRAIEHTSKNENILALKYAKTALVFSQNVHSHACCEISRSKDSKLWEDVQRRSRSLLSESIELESKILQAIADNKDEVAIPGNIRHLIVQRRQKKKLGYSDEDSLVVSSLEESGVRLWEDLYSERFNNIQICVEGNSFSLTECRKRLRSGTPEERFKVWTARNTAFKEQEDLFAHVLNAISTWKLKVHEMSYKLRPRISILENALLSERIDLPTFEDARLSVAAKQIEIRKKLCLFAKHLNKERLEQHDMSLSSIDPTSSSKKFTLLEAVQLLKRALAPIDDAEAFVDRMIHEKLIEASFSEDKKQGAYCTAFFKHEKPLIFMNFLGDLPSLLTLAHEMGHAYHYDKLSRQDFYERDFGNTLAESMSTLFEKLMLKQIEKESLVSSIDCEWMRLSQDFSYYLEIPALIELEERIYALKSEGKTLNPEILNKLTKEIYQRIYDGAIGNVDPLLWLRCRHLFFSNSTFYNYPYALGYLLSDRLLELVIDDSQGDRQASFQYFVNNSGRSTFRELVEKTFSKNQSDCYLRI